MYYKRTLSTDKILNHQNRFRMVETGIFDDHLQIRQSSSKGRQTMKPSSKMKKTDICNVKPAEVLLFREEENQADDIAKSEMTEYSTVYTTDYKDIVQVPQGSAANDLEDSVNHFLTEPNDNTSRNTKGINYKHDNFIEIQMRSHRQL